MRRLWERWLAWALLRRQGGRTFLRFITLLAIAGVAVGVAALELALFLSRGFSREITTKIMGFGAHVQVMRYTEGPLYGADSLLHVLEQLDPQILRAAPVVYGQVIAQGPRDVDGVIVQGVDPERDVSFIRTRLVEGRYGLEASERPTAMLSRTLARRLGVGLGGEFWLYWANGDPSSLILPRATRLRVAGLYETGLVDFDEAFVFVHIDQARSLLGYAPDAVSRIDVQLSDPHQAERVADEIEARLGFPVMARSIFRLYRNLFAWIELQQSTIPLVLGILVIVAAFNLVGTLLMMVLEKTAHIGILKTLGATDRSIARLFVCEGLLLGTIGVGLGNALALLLGFLQLRYGILPLPVEVYYVERAPVYMAATDLVLVSAVALLLCWASTWFPARIAARLHPVEALRFG
ncbi:MAG: ABC transporter permease [Bacteroidota bacterium]|nr:ABC transporter permease [Bacteroidota bacterium]MDW8138499.1 ABC transporter permease [Bacteroidota bacterium]